MDAFSWAKDATDKLKEGFGSRLAFVGLQGSRARGEANESSDIDLVVLIEDLDGGDLRACKSIIQSMPHADLACGFVGSPSVIESWPRHELFQFVNDTVSVYGEMPFTSSDFTKEDAKEAAIVGASSIYHATCHAAVFDGEAEGEILRQLAKGATFTLQALHFARTGEYVRKKSDLAKALDGEDAEVLSWSIRAKKATVFTNDETGELSKLLLKWSSKIINGI